MLKEEKLQLVGHYLFLLISDLAIYWLLDLDLALFSLIQFYDKQVIHLYDFYLVHMSVFTMKIMFISFFFYF